MVHILRHGQTICRDPSLPDLPGDWPEGEFWVSFYDARDATCALCRIGNILLDLVLRYRIGEKPCRRCRDQQECGWCRGRGVVPARYDEQYAAIRGADLRSLRADEVDIEKIFGIPADVYTRLERGLPLGPEVHDLVESVA